RASEEVRIPRGLKVRRLHKAFLRYHDANNWPVLREALRRMGRSDLIGNGKHQLVPAYQPEGTGHGGEGKRSSGGGRQHRRESERPGAAGGKSSRPFRTQHTGLPATPRAPPSVSGARSGGRARQRPR
ncbi:MAG TPA: DUF3362 domain-containing protein, partial [Steroidobacteraceae bacterium]|nr:DUF3362 domain-containing protein [Steroidobacteraceae bacterium]